MIWASGEVICSKWEGLSCQSKRTTCVSNHSLGGLKLKPPKWFCFWASGMQLGHHGVETGEQMSCQSRTYGEGAAWTGTRPGFLYTLHQAAWSLISAVLSGVHLLRKGPHCLGAFPSYRPCWCQTGSPSSSTTSTSHFSCTFAFPELDREPDT